MNNGYVVKENYYKYSKLSFYLITTILIMEIKLKDVEKNINENIPIETDYFIADLILDSDGINIDLLIKINETEKTYYIEGFDLNKVIDYLNELYETYDDFISKSPLFDIPNGFLAVIYNYYEDNKNKRHNKKYIWNLIEKVYMFIMLGEIIDFDEKDKKNLINWLNVMLNHNEKYDKIYWRYENEESFV